MASSALEEKINKIRLQNEEIRRRYEEVEADKKNAAKLNALVQFVPSDDWPERREPPEFSSPPKNLQKQKSITKDRENERPSQHYSGIQERLAKKDHKFAEGEGPPPDPKYNFLADSERETHATDNSRPDEDKNKSRNRPPRGGAGLRRRGSGNNVGGGGSRDAFFKDNRGPHAFHSREESLPEYEAWRAERDRIDEARINRQKTAEGNWRREWDCNKVSLEKDQPRRDFTRKDSNMYDRRNNHYDNDYSNRGHGGSRTYHQSQKNYSQDYRHPHHEQPHEFKRQQSDCKTPLSPVDNRTVAAFDQSIKVTVNQGNQANKATLMSVKGSNYRSRNAPHVNSPSIAGTGRVGPRQKSRITYISQSDSNAVALESNSFRRQKSFDEKTSATHFNNGPKLDPKSPFSQRKREGNAKSPYFSKKDFNNDESVRPKNQSKASHSQRNESRDQRQSNNFVPKLQRIQKRKLDFNKTGNVSVVEDSVPVENNINKSTHNVLGIQNNDHIQCETNEIGKEISDVSNVSDNSAVCDNEVIDDIDENVSFDDHENVEYDSNIVNEKNIEYDHIDDVMDDQFEDAEENHINIKTDNTINTDENLKSMQSDESFDVYAYLMDESYEFDISSANIDKESLTDHEKMSKTGNEVTLPVNSETTLTDVVEENPEAKRESSVSTQLLGYEIKDITQTPRDPKDKEVGIDFSQKNETIREEKSEEKTISKTGEEGDANNEESEQSNTVDLKAVDSKVEDNAANHLIESEKNTLVDDSLNKTDNDSGFLDNVETDSLNKTNTTTNDTANDSAISNCSNIVEDLDNSLDKLGTANENEKTPEPAKSDFVDVTKDDCKRPVEICDNISATSSDTQMNEDKEKINEILVKTIKDNDVKVIESDHQSSDTSKVITSQAAHVDAVEKKVEVSEIPVEIISKESKKE